MDKRRPFWYGVSLRNETADVPSRLSVKFYSVGEFSRNNKRGKPPLEWKCYNFRAQIKQRKGFPHGYYNKNWRNLE